MRRADGVARPRSFAGVRLKCVGVVRGPTMSTGARSTHRAPAIGAVSAPGRRPLPPAELFGETLTLLGSESAGDPVFEEAI